MHLITNPVPYEIDGKEVTLEKRNLELLNRSLLNSKQLIEDIAMHI